MNNFIRDPIAAQNSCPLHWWKLNAHRFPRLAGVACSMLSIPATATASERVFSTAGLTASKLCNCIKPKNLDAIVFWNKNYHVLKT